MKLPTLGLFGRVHFIEDGPGKAGHCEELRQGCIRHAAHADNRGDHELAHGFRLGAKEWERMRDETIVAWEEGRRS